MLRTANSLENLPISVDVTEEDEIVDGNITKLAQVDYQKPR